MNKFLTFLILAVKKARKKVASLLLKSGADPEIRNNWDKIARHFAKGRADLIMLFGKGGGPVD